jgi:hypothetical protein
VRPTRQRSELRPAASDPSRGIAVWPTGAAPVDGDPWAHEELLRDRLVRQLYDGAYRRGEMWNGVSTRKEAKEDISSSSGMRG